MLTDVLGVSMDDGSVSMDEELPAGRVSLSPSRLAPAKAGYSMNRSTAGMTASWSPTHALRYYE